MVRLWQLIRLWKSLFQPEYRILKKAFEEQLPKEAILRLFDNQNEIMSRNLSPINILEEMAKNHTNKSNIDCKFYESASDVPDPRDISPEKKNLIIFDDLLLERQNIRKTKQMWGLLHKRSSPQRGLFLLSSKLLQTATSDDKRKHELYLSLSARSQERQSYLQRPRK